MKKVSIVAKERRSSVGFFDFMKFRVFRGFLDGGVTAESQRSRRDAKKRGTFWAEEGLAQRRQDTKVEFRSFNLTVSIGQTRKDPKLQISSFFVS